jgi:hypothetical protein
MTFGSSAKAGPRANTSGLIAVIGSHRKSATRQRLVTASIACSRQAVNSDSMAALGRPPLVIGGLAWGCRPRLASVPFVMVHAIATFVRHCPNSEGQYNAENEQLGRDVNCNRNIGAIPLR